LTGAGSLVYLTHSVSSWYLGSNHSARGKVEFVWIVRLG